MLYVLEWIEMKAVLELDVASWPAEARTDLRDAAVSMLQTELIPRAGGLLLELAA